MPEGPRITGPFADALREGRERYNARFAAVRHQFRALDAARVAALLGSLAEPIVRAVHAHDASRARATADAAYDAVLDLVARDLDLHAPAAVEALGTIAPALAPAIAREPRRALAMIGNTTFHVAAMRPDRLDALARNLGAALPSTPDAIAAAPDCLASALVIAAWSCGIPMLRARALAALEATPDAIALGALGIEQSALTARELARRLRGDPWSTPSRLARGEPARPSLTVAAIVGGFRGFGGPLLVPPRAERAGGHLFLVAGADRFALYADRCGVRIEPSAAPARRAAGPSESIRLADDGLVEGFGHRSDRPILAHPIAGWAAAGRTLLAVPERSHRAFVVALVEST